MTNASKLKDELMKNRSQLQAKVSSLQKELASVKTAGDRVQGSFDH